jgi:hypothetical protein
VQANGTLLRTFVQRCGVYFALAALILQFALSFGHVHARDLFGPNAAHSTSNAVKAWNQSAKLEASAQLPLKLADDDDYCSICLSTFLLGTSFIPDAPQPPLPSQFAAFDPLLASVFNGLVQSQRGPFQSRAPPLDG